MAYRGVIERWPKEAIIYVHELPGYVAQAATVERAIAAARAGLENHIRWLDTHDLPIPPDTRLDFSVLEEMAAVAGIGPFFQSDLLTLSPAALEIALRVGSAVIEDLAAVYDDASAAQRSHKFRADERSAEEIMRHIAYQDVWYTTRLESSFNPQVDTDFLPQDAVSALRGANSYFIESLRAAYDPKRTLKYDVQGEEWSITKVLRRRNADLRGHYHDLFLAVRQRI